MIAMQTVAASTNKPVAPGELAVAGRPPGQYNSSRMVLHPLVSTVPKFTALIHTPGVQNLAQTLRSARVASETLVIHPSDPAVARLCLRYGARDIIEVPGVRAGSYAMDAFYDWLLLLHPGEELSVEALAAFDRWHRQRGDESAGYLLRREDDCDPHLRLVNRTKVRWVGDQPQAPAGTKVFPGLIVLGSTLRAA